MAGGKLKFLSNVENLVTESNVTASATKAVTNCVFPGTPVRSGFGGVTLSGTYTGSEDATFDVEITNDLSPLKTISDIEFLGIGNGVMSGVAAANLDQQNFTVTLIDLGTETIQAAVQLYGVIIEAVSIGHLGNGISISVDTSGIVKTDSDYSVIDTIAAGDEGQIGDQNDYGAFPLNGDGALNAATPRLAFGSDPQIFKQHKVLDEASGDWKYILTPPPPRPIPAGTRVKVVSGDYSVSIVQGVTTEVYPGVVTLYDLLSDIIAASLLVTVSGTVANDRTPGGMAAIDIPLRTEPYIFPITGTGTAYAVALLSDDLAISLHPLSPTETVTLTCVADGLVGQEEWEVSGAVTGTRDLRAVTGETYIDPEDRIEFTIPERVPPEPTNDRFRHTLTTYATRTTGEYKPPICLEQMTLGPAATEKTLTLEWKVRPPSLPECGCDNATLNGYLDPTCIGTDIEGGDSAMDILYKKWLSTIMAWKYARMTVNVELTPGDGDVRDTDDDRLRSRYSALLEYDRVDIKAVDRLCDSFYAYLKDVYSHAANVAAAWATATDYEEGDIVKALTGDAGLYYVATRDHTSGVEPTWTSDIGDITTDGDWECAGTRPIYAFEDLWTDMTAEFELADTGLEGAEWWRSLNLAALSPADDYPTFSASSAHKYVEGTHYVRPDGSELKSLFSYVNTYAIVLTDGASTVDLGFSLDDYYGQLLWIADSAGKIITGYISTVRTEFTTIYKISSTPGGTTYSWASKEVGFDPADATGWWYKITTAFSSPVYRFLCTTGGVAGESWLNFVPAIFTDQKPIYDGMIIRATGTDVEFTAELIDPGAIEAELISDADINSQIQLYVKKWQSALDDILVMADIEPPFAYADTTTTTSGSCWQDIPTEAGYWEVNAGEYLPAFNNYPYHSCKAGSDGEPFSTKEFAFFVVVACPQHLKEGDKLTLQIDGAEKAYARNDRIAIQVVSRGPLELAGGQTGTDLHTWRVRGSVEGQISNYVLDLTAPVAYSWVSGIKTLGFLITPGAIDYVLGDEYSFSVEAGQFRWRKDSGAWSGSVDIQSTVLLSDGLSAVFDPGPAPSFEIGDSYSFDVRQKYAPSHVATPDLYPWCSGVDATGCYVQVALGAAISDVTIALVHDWPAVGTQFRLSFSPNGFTAVPVTTIIPTYREKIMYHVTDEATIGFKPTHVRVYGIHGTLGASLNFFHLYISDSPITISIPAQRLELTDRHVMHGSSGGINRIASYSGTGKSGTVQWREFLTATDIASIRAMIAHLKENNDLPVLFVPHTDRPSDIRLVQVVSDDLTIGDAYQFEIHEGSEPTDDRQYHYSCSLELRGVVF